MSGEFCTGCGFPKDFCDGVGLCRHVVERKERIRLIAERDAALARVRVLEARIARTHAASQAVDAAFALPPCATFEEWEQRENALLALKDEEAAAWHALFENKEGSA